MAGDRLSNEDALAALKNSEAAAKQREEEVMNPNRSVGEIMEAPNTGEAIHAVRQKFTDGDGFAGALDGIRGFMSSGMTALTGHDPHEQESQISARGDDGGLDGVGAADSDTDRLTGGGDDGPNPQRGDDGLSMT